VRSALVCVLVMMVVGACARPVSTLQTPPSPTPTPSPSPTPTAPLQASTAPFHVGEVGLGYSAVALSATGGVQPYTWSISAGALPNGLTLGSDGSVSGTPTSAGNFSFTIQVADSGGSTATVSGKIGIAAHLSASLIAACATQCSVELGCVNVCGAFGQLSGGVGPYSYTHTSGQLPAGTALSSLSLTGTFTGLSGYLQFSVQVTDSLGVTASVAPIFWMHPHISVAASATCGPIYFRIGCASAFAYSGGTPGGTPSASVTKASATLCTQTAAGGYVCGPTTSVPPGFSTSVGSGKLVVSVPADPNGPYYTWTGTITMVLTDQSLCAASTRCVSGAATLTVDLNGG
jgi:putative Ig domain-containing protein